MRHTDSEQPKNFVAKLRYDYQKIVEVFCNWLKFKCDSNGTNYSVITA